MRKIVYYPRLEMTSPLNREEAKLKIEHMFASAWQDGVNHLNPKYLRRDTLFTDETMKLLDQYAQQVAIERDLLQEQLDNLNKWFVAHPNDSLSDFIKHHVSSFVYEARNAELEKEKKQ